MKPITAPQYQMLRRIEGYDPHGCPMRCGEILAPIRRLIQRGLVEFQKPRFPGWRHLQITDAGRRALGR